MLLEAPAAQRPSGRVLRPYQHEAAAAVVEDWATGVTRTTVVLPTGCGKTDVIAALATDEARRGGRVLVLAHREELLDQITDRCAQHDAGLRVGRVQGSRDEVHYPIVVAMVQTLQGRRAGEYRRLARFPQPTMVIVDECHHAAAAGYMAVLAGLGCFGSAAMAGVPGCEHRANRPDVARMLERGPVQALGVTATLVRGDDRALGDVWESVSFARDIAWAVRMRFLVPPRGRVVVADSVKLDRAKLRGGDYRDNELGKMITQSAAQIVADWLEHGRHDPGPDGQPGPLRATAAFCPNLESAEALAAEFVVAGVAVGVVTGKTPTGARRKLYRDLAAGVITVLVSVMVLTEGWDCPRVSCILQCRPTRLPGLYAQIVGRGLRPWDVADARALGLADDATPAKVDCLILDVVGASRGQKLTTLVDLHESAAYDTSELDDALRCPACGGEHEDGQCLADELEELELGPDQDEDERRPGPEVDEAGPAKDYHEIQLLADDADWTWLLTAAGRPFLPVGQRFVFLWEAPGRHASRWSVGFCSSPVAKRWEPGGYLGHGLTLSDARALAENWAAYEPGAALAGRAAKWRKGRPSPEQCAIAERYGINPAGMSRAQVLDAISVALATVAIDGLA